MNILCDVDDVLADLLTEWVRRYNEDWGDNLKTESFTEWDMTKFVKPECGSKIFRYLDLPDLYHRVDKIPGSLLGVHTLRSMGHRVIFATSGVGGAPAKFKWLTNNEFIPGEFGRDFVCINDKSLLRGDLLIDDRYENVRDFHNVSDKPAILLNKPHNKSYEWPWRAENWYEIVKMVRMYQEVKEY